MNLLMVIAVIGGVVLQQWFEAAAITALFSLALLLESWRVGQALMTLAPETARSYTAEGALIETALDEVMVGTTCVVRPGERIPFDGKITKGSSYLNEAPITGESLPVEKSIGAGMCIPALSMGIKYANSMLQNPYRIQRFHGLSP